MGVTRQAALWERDPESYWQALYGHIGEWEGDDEEQNATYWLAHSVHESDDEDIFRIVGLGYIVGSYEAWSRSALSEPIGLFANLRAKEQREMAELGIEDRAFNLVYGCRILQSRIGEVGVEGDDTQLDRLNLAYQRLVVEKFETPPSTEEQLHVRSVFDLGLAQHLYSLWWANMDELGYDLDQRWADLEVASELIGGGPLAGLSFPINVRGCVVDLTDTLGYEIRSEGKMGGRDVSVFIAKGDEANVVSSVKSGWSGARDVDLPNPKHVDVLRDLGFQTATFPNGKHYRLSSMGGLSGIRRIKE